jgi:nucleoside-diphosphate-sugar epimerase
VKQSKHPKGIMFIKNSLVGALPFSFKRQRLLIVGCGDVGQRLLAQLPQNIKAIVLSSSVTPKAELRQYPVRIIYGNLDQKSSLKRLSNLAPNIVHLAPPATTSLIDIRTQNLIRTLRTGTSTQNIIYGSTSGVYGDCAGQWIDETRLPAPSTDRAKRRVSAETQLRQYGKQAGIKMSILRIPGIYSLDRSENSIKERLLSKKPTLIQEDDVYTNHIHANDLANIIWHSLFKAKPQRIYHASDDTSLKMADYFDLAAEILELPKTIRISRTQAKQELAPLQLSFMSESRRMKNIRLKQELRVKLRFPTVKEGLSKTGQLLHEQAKNYSFNDQNN